MSLLLALLLCVPADTFVVDDDGGPHADFTSIVDALAAAHANDIIKVMPGDYAPFQLTKNLLIMGPADGAKPTVQGRSVVFTPGAMIAGRPSLVRAQDVTGRLLLDDCSIGVAVSVTQDTLELLTCEQVRAALQHPGSRWGRRGDAFTNSRGNRRLQVRGGSASMRPRTPGSPMASGRR
jgi:hypothetical protein